MISNIQSYFAAGGSTSQAVINLNSEDFKYLSVI